MSANDPKRTIRVAPKPGEKGRHIRVVELDDQPAMQHVQGLARRKSGDEEVASRAM
jgi:hypothetical protein